MLRSVKRIKDWVRQSLGGSPFFYRLAFGIYKTGKTILVFPLKAIRKSNRILVVSFMVHALEKRARKVYFSGLLAKEPETFVLYRILGNDLPPRHQADQTYNNLKFTLEHEPELEACKKIWVLNRILDSREQMRLESLLNQFGKEYLVIPFRQEEYKALGFQYDGLPGTGIMSNGSADPRSKIHRMIALAYIFSTKNRYAMNINGSKNLALAHGKQQAKWVLPWDGNCFLTEEAWREIRSAVCAKPWVNYFIVPMARVTNNHLLLSDDYKPITKEEPQIIFRNDTREVFNELFPYGQQNKLELLKKLGVPGQWDHWALRLHPWEKTRKAVSPERYRFAKCGWVARLSSGNPLLEVSSDERSVVRKESIVIFLKKVDLDLWAERFRAYMKSAPPKPKTGENHLQDHRARFDDLLTRYRRIRAQRARDHRGVWHDFRIASLAVCLENLPVLYELAITSGLRLKEQIDENGRLPRELKSDQSLHHCVLALQGWINLADLLNKTVGFDLWRFESDGRGSIERALMWLLPYCREEWPYTQKNAFDRERLFVLFHLTQETYPEVFEKFLGLFSIQNA